MAGSRGRRFIAGAVCAHCRAVDRVVLLETGGRECVACGRVDAPPSSTPTPTSNDSPALNISTRLDRTAKSPDSAGERAVRIVPLTPDAGADGGGSRKPGT